MSKPASTDRVDAYWARFLGVAADALSRPGIVATQHAALGSWQGLWCFTRGESCVISAPPAWIARLRDGAAKRAARDAAQCVELALGAAAGLRVGPSYQAWLPPDRIPPVVAHDVRRLGPGEGAAFTAMRQVASSDEWEHSGIAANRTPTWGAFAGEEVAALG